MRINTPRIWLVALVIFPSSLVAQARGTLIPREVAPARPDSANRYGILTINPSLIESRLKQIYGVIPSYREQEQVRLLLTGPSTPTEVHSSSLQGSLQASSGDDEVKLQANACELLPCAKLFMSAISAALTAPLNKDDDHTELADLDGLAGTTRLTGTWTTDVTKIRQWLPSFTVKGAYSRPEFIYSTPLGATVSTDTVRREGFSVAGGPTWKGSSASLGFTGRYEQKYKAKDETSICDATPITGTTSIQCTQSRLGAPTEQFKTVVAGEVRYAFSTKTAVAASVSRDIRNWVTGIDVPVWFALDKDGKLTAGVRGGYRSDTKKYSAAIFFGAWEL